MDYYNLAIKRESTRSFKKKPVLERQLEELQDYFLQCRKLIEDIPVTIELLGPETQSILSGCAGYHNFMIEAPHYLLISSPKMDHYLENAGYIGEDLVMKLTELELESCWITVGDSTETKKRLSLPENMEPCALIAFGNATVMLPSSRLDIKSISDVTIKNVPASLLQNCLSTMPYTQKTGVRARRYPHSPSTAACTRPSLPPAAPRPT